MDLLMALQLFLPEIQHNINEPNIFGCSFLLSRGLLLPWKLILGYQRSQKRSSQWDKNSRLSGLGSDGLLLKSPSSTSQQSSAFSCLTFSGLVVGRAAGNSGAWRQNRPQLSVRHHAGLRHARHPGESENFEPNSLVWSTRSSLLEVGRPTFPWPIIGLGDILLT